MGKWADVEMCPHCGSYNLCGCDTREELTAEDNLRAEKDFRNGVWTLIILAGGLVFCIIWFVLSWVFGK